MFIQIRNFFSSLDLYREIPKGLIVNIIAFATMVTAKIILMLLSKKHPIPKWLAFSFSIQQSESLILPIQANVTPFTVRKNFMVNTIKYCKEHFFIILFIASFLGLVGNFYYVNWRRSHPVKPKLEDQPIMFYIHSNDSETYPELGVVISLQSVKTFGTKDEIGAKCFRLTTFEQDPNQNSKIRKHVKVTEKESVDVGEFWDFKIDDLWYRIVFKYYTYKETGDCAAFELSQLTKKKD